MKSYYVSCEEYDHIISKIMKSKNGCIIHDNLLIQDLGAKDEPDSILVCAYTRDVKTGHYEWMDIPNPYDYEVE